MNVTTRRDLDIKESFIEKVQRKKTRSFAAMLGEQVFMMAKWKGEGAEDALEGHERKT